MKKYKQFVVGLIVGAMLFSSIGVFAEGIAVLLNPYPVYVNGTQLVVEGYNINGFTFLKLADIGKAFNSTTLFNETEQRIDINSNVVESLSITEALESTAPVIKITPDGIEVEVINGIECIALINIHDKYYDGTKNSYNVNTQPNDESKFTLYYFEPNTGVNEHGITIVKRTVLINDIPTIKVTDPLHPKDISIYYVEYNYYIETILPLIKSSN
jgi:hypothetical protein